MNERIGKMILHYRILEQIGQGGIGVVNKTRNSNLDRYAAINRPSIASIYGGKAGARK